jgi:hypothetical protein
MVMAAFKSQLEFFEQLLQKTMKKARRCGGLEVQGKLETNLK